MSRMGSQKSGRRARRQCSEEFKAGAVRLVLDEGKTVGAVARELDLVASSLASWVTPARAGRTKADEALRESEGHYRTVVEDQTEVICRFKADGTFTFVNDVFCRFFDKTRGELLGRKWQPAALAEDVRIVEEGLHLLSPSNPVVVVENRVHSGRGELRWMQFVNRAFFDAAGRLAEIQSVGRDITERKQAEETLKKVEADYRRLTENSPDLIARFDARLRHLYVNPAAARAGKLSVSDYIGLTITETGVPEPIAATWDRRIREVLTTGKTMDLEDSFPTPEGVRYFHTRLAPELTPDGSVCSVLSVARDITERKRAEQALTHSRDLMRYIIEHNRSAVAVHDRGLKYLYVSQRYLQEYKVNEHDVIGKHHYDVFPDLPQKWRDVHQKALAGEISSAEDDPYVRQDGTVDWTRWECRPWYQADGSIGGIIIYTEVITERKRAEARMQTFSQEIIAAREAERKQVSADLHHDVGSLMVGMSAHLDAIEEELRSGKPQEALKWMKRARKQFDQSIGRLKDLAIQLRPPELDVLGLRATLRQHFAQVTRHRGARIHFTETLGRRRISENTATTLFRLAQEAVTNAIKHGHAKRVDVGLRAMKDHISLTVRDNGEGFDPSERLAPEASQMGLRVMREMAAFAGGAFELHSVRGTGTKVRVNLPFAPATAASGPGAVTVKESTMARRGMTRAAGRGARPRKRSGA